ncbi:hypothetical protein CVT24_001297 [Panaeolus cyanescens]|uniref:Uncharacterized protein n=1 Tax=Panaeolus cyanescens TaxID=181874 RepID=A0A409YZ00_9AGAR|nr:hypothetical protein CVT24_001297 [Panaeolus cyanescens]
MYDVEGPPLPPELVHYIFELAATNPDDPYHPHLHILLVCKLIYQEFKPVIYRTVVLEDYSELTEFPLDACRYIQNLSIDAVRWPMKDFFSHCTTLKSFHSYDLSPDDLSGDDEFNMLPPSTRLTSLWAPPGWETSRACDRVLVRDQFVHLTHLNTVHGLSALSMLRMLVNTLGGLKSLTHLAMQYVSLDGMGLFEQILTTQSALKVIVLVRYDWHMQDPEYDVDYMTPLQKEDERIVRLVDDTSDDEYESQVVDEWLARIYRHRLDLWDFAEALKEARRDGHFRDPRRATGWIFRECLWELLSSEGVAKLSRRSELWYEYLDYTKEW